MTESQELFCPEGVLWQLDDLYAGIDDTAISSDSEWCKKEAAAIHRSFHSRVAQMDATALQELIACNEQLDCRLGKLATYAFLNHCTQHENEEAAALEQKIRELEAECKAQTVFFQLEWNALPEKDCSALLAAAELSDYRYYLNALRRYRPHQLTETEEKILLARKPVGREAWLSLFDKILSSYRFGDKKRQEEEVLADLYSANRQIRKNAAAEMTEGLTANAHILTHIFNVLAAEKMISDKLRSHTSWISAMNLHNDLHDSTVETLVATVTSRYDIVARYYTAKKELLGLDRLEDYDRYAPLPSLPKRTICWDECKEMVLASFAAFSPRMAEIAQQFFSRRWIHAPVIAGKQGGAFSHPAVPQIHPYIMVNYTGNINDVSTVAHELGHGVHQMLAAEKGLYNSDTPLPLAETASVFAEMLVFTSQLELLRDTAERRALICQKLESIFATVFRQTAMNRFEHAMHNGRRKYGELSRKQLSNYWLSTQQAMFGDSIQLGEEYALWWSYIPHFLSTPGYVYSYAFGELLVLALYGIYQQEKERGKEQAFVDNYLALLAAGGSDSPYQLLQPFGIDLESASFWHRGLDVIEQMLIEAVG